MGGQQSSDSTLTLEKTVVEEHMKKIEVLKSELLAKSEENQFLRRRIVNDLTEHAGQLEEELRRERARRSIQTKTLEKYTSLCRKLEAELRAKKTLNESLIAENNQLLSDLLFSCEGPREAGQDNTCMYQLLQLHKRLEKAKIDSDCINRGLLEKIGEDQEEIESDQMELFKVIGDYNRCKEKIQNARVISNDDTIFPEVEQRYRNSRGENSRKKIDYARKAYRIEEILRELSEQLEASASKVIEEIQPVLEGCEEANVGLRGVSFEGDRATERELWRNAMRVGEDEIKYLEKVLAYNRVESWEFERFPLVEVEIANDAIRWDADARRDESEA